MAGNLSSLLSVILPKRRANPKGVSATPTFNPPSADQPLSSPAYREHLVDIFDTRAIQDSRTLLRDLFKHDPDVSSAVNAYLTVADTEPLFFVRDPEGRIDRNGHQLLAQVLQLLTTQIDYTQGFLMKPSLATHSEMMRYMLLLRGAIGVELVFDKNMVPSEIRHVDMNSITWVERSPGLYKPMQNVPGRNDPIDLDIPNFFVGFFRRDPTQIYTYSNFVAAINTIAARQQVINDLYRIMRTTGFPRTSIKVIEEVLVKNAPAGVRANQDQLRQWLNDRLREIGSTFSTMRADQAFVHFDSVEAKIINDKNPGATLDIKPIIDTLNAQNQAALKTMATIIGRGESGVNTASVEARIFSMNADQLNQPIADIYSKMFTMALRLQGHPGYVECRFRKAELRPEMELEPHYVMRAARLKEDLSLGIIDDDEYHIQMYGRIRPDGAPTLSGTGFMQAGKGARVDTESISPNSDPMGRSLTPEGSKSARSKQVKKSQ